MLSLFRRENEAERWLNANVQTNQWAGFQHWRNEPANRHKTVADYIQEWIVACAAQPTGIAVSEHDGTWAELNRRIADANLFSLRLTLNSPGKITNKLINELEIGEHGSITLVDCTIRTLDLRQDEPRYLRLENCKVGTLRLRRASVGTFEMVNCSVRRIFAPSPTRPHHLRAQSRCEIQNYRQRSKMRRPTETCGIT